MALSMIRHALYVCHRDTSEQELFSIPSAVYVELDISYKLMYLD